MTTLLIALLITLSTLVIIRRLFPKQSLIWFHFFLLASTPWLLTLFLAHPPLSPIPQEKSLYARLSDNLSYLTSFDFLFFYGDRRPGYGTGEHGVFLLSFLPLIVTGLYACLTSSKKPLRLIPLWLVSGLAIAVTLTSVAGLPSALWFLPQLSLLTTIGANSLLNLLKSRQSSLATKSLIGLNFAFLVYEVIRLYQIIIFHQPFNL